MQENKILCAFVSDIPEKHVEIFETSILPPIFAAACKIGITIFFQ